MEIWKESIDKALNENDFQTSFFEKQIKDYEELIINLKRFNETYSPSILVPLCDKVLMKGNLIHTNEILVSIGSGYFAKTSSKNAQDLAQNRIKVIEEKLKRCKAEYDFLKNQIQFSKSNIFETDGNEIVEPYDEESEKEWNKQHRLKMKKHRIEENQEIRMLDNKKAMNKLDILELQEDMNSFDTTVNANEPVKDTIDKESTKKQLEEKLATLRSREKPKCVTEDDIIKRLDELEEEEELEDELRRLKHEDENYISSESSVEMSDESEDEIIDHVNNSEDVLPSTSHTEATKKRKVSFAQEVQAQSQQSDEEETLNLNFTHTDTPSASSSDQLESPGDIYKCFPECVKKTKPIIKNCHKVSEESRAPENSIIGDIAERLTKSLVLGDVVEHNSAPSLSENTTDNPTRQISKFKSMRLKNKQT